MSSPSYANHVGIFQSLYCESLSSCQSLHCSSAGKYIKKKKKKKKKTSAELCIKDCWFGLSSLPFIKLQKGISSHSRPVCEKGMITATRSCPCENCLNKYRHEKYEPILVLPVSGWFRNSSISTCWKWYTVMFTAQWAPSSGLPVISSYYKQIPTQP